MLGVAHCFAGAVVEEGLLAEATLLDHVLLLDCQDVAALVHDGACVTLLALQLDGHFQCVLFTLHFIEHVEALVRLCLDDLDEGIVVDVAAEEQLLQFGVDAEGVEHLLAQVEVFFHANCEVTFFVVGTGDLDLVKLHCLFECECRQVGPDLLVLKRLSYF